MNLLEISQYYAIQSQNKKSKKTSQTGVITSLLTTAAALYLMSHNDDAMADTEVNVPGKRKHVIHVDKAANERIVIKTEPEKGNLVVDQGNATITYFSDEPQHDTYIYDLVSDDGSAIWWLLGALIIGAAIAAGASSGGGSSGNGGGQVSGIDYSDAPESYSFGDDGTGMAVLDSPNHAIIQSLFLGSVSPDPEDAALPSQDALEDDKTDTPDEAVFRQSTDEGPHELSFSVDSAGDETSLFATVSYTATNLTGDDAFLSAWIDLNFDGDFDDEGEKVISEFVIANGANEMSYDFLLPLSPEDLGIFIPGLLEPLNQSYIRFRLSTDESSVTTPYGSSPDGEVEDIEILLTRMNFAPAKISGFVYDTDMLTGLENIDVFAAGTSAFGDPVNLMGTTDANGMYMIDGIPLGEDYKVMPDPVATYNPTDIEFNTMPGGFQDGFDFVLMI